ncbi:LysR substrate-binding domain-containing protein [Jatrophihabitans endophyticus]|uniref:LysR substrate-binding domain-containing protein n=1 Tax=Jatrophihabitans endophyticus TaxID=1206085 RepID=UPI00093212E7|nr:LysR substrate-binding domain-containing protein [Jatrophihabitans endophyticus]
MQLQQLAYFVAVADIRHFTRAADEMDVAQPTLSQQIRALERSLGAPLFARSPGNVELTAAGAELLPIARRMLAEADNARLALRELGELGRGKVRLGATPSLCTGLVPKIIGDYHRSHPGVAIVITEGGSRDLQRLLAEGALDLALLVDSRAQDDPRLVTEPLFVEELVVISALDAPPPTRRARMQVAELRSKQLVMFREGYDLRETTLAACRAEGFEPTFAVEGGEMDAVLGFVAAGLGVAVVPSTVVGERFRTTRLASPGLARTVQVARRSGVELSRAAAELAASIGRATA